MSLEHLIDLPPWEWPKDAAKTLRKALSDPQSEASEREAAVELAGDYTVVNDELAGLLLGIIVNSAEKEEIRAKAAISLGPALETADEAVEWDDDDVPITEAMFHKIQGTLQQVYGDESVPQLVRRRALEASVRADAGWHADAVSKAYASGDRDWVLTAVFAMRFLEGFDDQIVEAVDSTDADIQMEAVRAAGAAESEAAWTRILALLGNPTTPRHVLFAAIEAVSEIRPEEAEETLQVLTRSRDQEIALAAKEAIAAADDRMEMEARFGGEEDDDEEEEEEEEEDE